MGPSTTTTSPSSLSRRRIRSRALRSVSIIFPSHHPPDLSSTPALRRAYACALRSVSLRRGIACRKVTTPRRLERSVQTAPMCPSSSKRWRSARTGGTRSVVGRRTPSTAITAHLPIVATAVDTANPGRPPYLTTSAGRRHRCCRRRVVNKSTRWGCPIKAAHARAADERIALALSVRLKRHQGVPPRDGAAGRADAAVARSGECRACSLFTRAATWNDRRNARLDSSRDV